MKVHHLDCGSMHLPGAPLVCHVLLLETDAGLVLVDTGFGLEDIADPRRRIGPVRHLIRPSLDPALAAANQVEALGFSRADVRHIVVTHFDVDHIGGLADFPDAQVHTTAAEVLGAVTAPSLRERRRYRAAQWAHGPKLVEHSPSGEAWRGFAAAQPLSEVDDGIVLLALPGHSRGHMAVAVDAGHRWLLHAGDAFYSPATIDGVGRVPASLWVLETGAAVSRRQVADNHRRLAELHQRQEPDLLIVSAHDPSLLAAAQATA